jgi:DNA-binding transcriptional regulator GbsR (MarR family)
LEFLDCKDRFIETWGELGNNWGISKSMAQLHALLLLSPHPMKVEQILNKLNISAGMVSMNLRNLMDWGLIYNTNIDGDRCEYYFAEKNLNIIFKRILEHRKKRELDPILDKMQEISKCACKCDESKELVRITNEITDYANKADKLFEVMIKTDSHWLFNSLMKVIK